MIRLRFTTTLLLTLVVYSNASTADEKFVINLIVRGADPGVGQIMASLFDSSEKYMRDPLVETDADVDAAGHAFFDLGQHDPGGYAIVVFYDKNGNGKLDTGLFRIPKEKIGFSNNAKRKFGPAKWDDARFLLSDADLQIDIQLKSAKRGQ